MNKSEEKKIFTPIKIGSMELKNRFVMSPLTRCRAIGNIPNNLMAEYYSQRAGSGLIITEGTSPSPNGLGYARIPGLYNSEQVNGWKLVTEKVHAKNGKIFVQIMHTGRVTHPLNQPTGAKHIAPSAIPLSGQMWTDSEGMKDYPLAIAMSSDDITDAIREYVKSAKLAMEANFDGVELHAANGYLLEQFLNPKSNHRTDSYGGSPENRNRFVIEVVKQVAEKIGKEKVGIRLSPYGAFNDMGEFEGIEMQFTELTKQLSEIGILYVHTVNHSSMGAPEVPDSILKSIRTNFKGSLILSGGYDLEKAEKDISESNGDLIAFGRSFLANPDLVDRFKNGNELTAPNMDTFYTADEKGYTDYPVLKS